MRYTRASIVGDDAEFLVIEMVHDGETVFGMADLA
jgi:hypothetical protein